MNRLVALMAACPITLFADPAPFGLEIGVAASAEAHERADIRLRGRNRYGHEHYAIEPSTPGVPGLKEATAIFDRNGTLVAVLTVYARDRFESLYDGLREKYDLVAEEMPSEGTRSARFVDGNTTIDLEAMHLGFTLSLHYWDTDVLRQVEADLGNRQSAGEARRLDRLWPAHDGPTNRGVQTKTRKTAEIGRSAARSGTE